MTDRPRVIDIKTCKGTDFLIWNDDESCLEKSTEKSGICYQASSGNIFLCNVENKRFCIQLTGLGRSRAGSGNLKRTYATNFELSDMCSGENPPTSCNGNRMSCFCSTMFNTKNNNFFIYNETCFFLKKQTLTLPLFLADRTYAVQVQRSWISSFFLSEVEWAESIFLVRIL